MEFMKDPNYMSIMQKMQNPKCIDIFEAAKNYPAYISLTSLCLNVPEDKIENDVKKFFSLKKKLESGSNDEKDDDENERKENGGKEKERKDEKNTNNTG
jgi:hypothetical protein